MPKSKHRFIKNISPKVKEKVNATWFNRIADLFDPNSQGNILGEQIAHLILYANDNVRFNDVTNLLNKSFPESLLVIKQEYSKESSKVHTDPTDQLSTVTKGSHFHCFITYQCSPSLDPHKSFRSKVREMLKNKGNKSMLKPAVEKMRSVDYARPYKFTGYNIITDFNKYDTQHLALWDVFYETSDERRAAIKANTIGQRCLVNITNNNAMKVLNWMAYIAKRATSKGRKNCIVTDNRVSFENLLSAA
ncbi:hypothetical protein [Pseudoalteromonas sp. T1lg22]|uniref:hypothetical protein n=1 Tax=Pseudoalteromonas sp. T1lg22 TaxID=2077096 RepID=UPI000CF6C5C3|nr:hypothetical protein [Pseudoalteromonas sp. T1lg22]